MIPVTERATERRLPARGTLAPRVGEPRPHGAGGHRPVAARGAPVVPSPANTAVPFAAGGWSGRIRAARTPAGSSAAQDTVPQERWRIHGRDWMERSRRRRLPGRDDMMTARPGAQWEATVSSTTPFRAWTRTVWTLMLSGLAASSLAQPPDRGDPPGRRDRRGARGHDRPGGARYHSRRRLSRQLQHAAGRSPDSDGVEAGSPRRDSILEGVAFPDAILLEQVGVRKSRSRCSRRSS